MNRLLLAATLVALTACKIGGSETTSAGNASCTSAGGACAQNADCCSYGCQAGVCAPNPVEGGTCRTTNDCAFFRLCKSGACTTPTAGMCRDNADVCTWWSDCCSGNCTTGSCTVNQAPIADAGPNVPDAPYTQPFTLVNNSTDPDGDPLIYGWTLTVPAASRTAALSSTTAANPTFTPDVVGAYVVRLVVTDGPAGAPNRLTSQAQITINVVNRAPVATVTAPPATWSRNVALSLSGAVSDPDGDVLDCTWQVTAPGAAAPVVIAPSAPCANPSAPAVQYTPALEGAYQIDLVVHDHDRTTGAVVNTTVASATFTSVNDPPVANAGPDQVWNLGATVAQNPTVPLTGAFTDPNGDAASSWQWTLVTPPAGSALAAGTVLSSAQTASFVPDVAGRYAVQLQVCDRPASCGTAVANVDVYRTIQDFGDGRVVNASDYAHGADRIAMAGPDPTNATVGKVWLRDPTGAAAEISASLDAVPDTLAVTPAGDWAVAGNSLWLWVVRLSTAPPTVTKVANPVGALGSIALAGTEAIVFPLTGSGYFYHFTYTTATAATVLTNAYYTGNVGRVDAAGAYLYVLQTGYSAMLTRYQVTNKGGFGLTYLLTEYLPYGSATSDLWVATDGTHLFLDTGDIQAASTLTSTGVNLGLAPRWVDSLGDGRAAALALDRLWLFNSALTHSGDDLFPMWGVAGVGYSVVPDGGFIRVDPLDATKTLRYVLVHANGTAPWKSGVVTYP